MSVPGGDRKRGEVTARGEVFSVRTTSLSAFRGLVSGALDASDDGRHGDHMFAFVDYILSLVIQDCVGRLE